MSLRERWGSGKVTLGGWCAIGSAFSAELLGWAGFDWICIDVQHGLIGYEQMVAMLQAVSGTGTPAFVRVADADGAGIMKVLDAGAVGVIVPLVETAEQAVGIVQACRYPPDGERSWGPIRASLGSSGFSPESANRDVICVVMVETPKAIANLDEILAVRGVDAALIGSNDLALSSGLKPSFTSDSSVQMELVLSVQRACRRHGVVSGIAAGDTATALRWLKAGFDMLALPSDVGLLTQGARASIQALRQASGQVDAGGSASGPVEV